MGEPVAINHQTYCTVLCFSSTCLATSSVLNPLMNKLKALPSDGVGPPGMARMTGEIDLPVSPASTVAVASRGLSPRCEQNDKGSSTKSA